MPMTRLCKVKKALYEACLEEICNRGFTPHINVITSHPEYSGTRDYESALGFTTFNISVNAIVGYSTDSTGISFGTKFAGVHQNIFIPWQALQIVYAKEDPNYTQFFTTEVTSEEAVVKNMAKLTTIEGGNTDGTRAIGKKVKKFKHRIDPTVLSKE